VIVVSRLKSTVWLYRQVARIVQIHVKCKKRQKTACNNSSGEREIGKSRKHNFLSYIG
jgi:hypothetical protein